MTATLFLAVELFAGWSAFWAERGWLNAATPGGGPDALGAAELIYVWHVVDAVPALDVAETLHWDRPEFYPDMRSAVLILLRADRAR